jgi:hypothetical protein
MEENQLPSKQDKPRALMFLKMGLFEIFLVVAGLLLLFGMLNYFNILPVSDVFPNQLGFLPRQIKQTAVTPPPVRIIPDKFIYDSAKAKELLTKYIKDTIKPEFVPPIIEIKEGSPDFSSKYTIGKVTVSATFRYTKKTNVPDSYGITIKSADLSKTAPTASLANSLLSDYFLNPYSVADCQKVKIASFCENYQAVSNGKQGYGIATDKSSTILFSCFLTKESDYFEQTSCIPH